MQTISSVDIKANGKYFPFVDIKANGKYFPFGKIGAIMKAVLSY